MPLISVIVPVYKVEAYLKECVDSILNQTFKDFELILVDDGSPDNCPTMCEEYARNDNRITVIHKENGGLSSARNAGLDYVFANSNSEYISFIDSDDYVDKDFLKKLYEAINGCDMSMCFYHIKQYDGNVIEVDSSSTYDFLDEQSYWDACLNNTMKVSPWNKLYRAELFNKLRYPSVRCCEDGMIIHHIIERCKKIHIIKHALYWYRQRLDSTMALLKQDDITFLTLQIESHIEKAHYFYSKGIYKQFVNAQKKENHYYLLIYQKNTSYAKKYYTSIKRDFSLRKKLRLPFDQIKLKDKIMIFSPFVYCAFKKMKK